MSAQVTVQMHAPRAQRATQGSLALDFEPLREAPLADVVPIPCAPEPVEPWARRYAQAVAEIASGDRPASQVMRWTHPPVYADLQRRARLVASAGGRSAGVERGSSPQPRVLSVHCFPIADAVLSRGAVVECCITVNHGARNRAIAARFERRRGRWLCTALEFA